MSLSVTDITARQEEILNRVVESHIDLAEPISSEYLKKRFRLPFSTATIRTEMQRLTETGHLHQPYTSAGRVPTDKGYRFFVNNLEKAEKILNKELSVQINKMRQEVEDYFTLLVESSRLLSLFSSGLAVSYLFGTEFFVKDGWNRTLGDPEFSDANKVRDFFSMIDYFEDGIDDFDLSCESVRIYIGNEAPISKSEDFSIIISKCLFFEGREGILAILGPKRMAYDKNISLLDSIVKILNEDKKWKKKLKD
ncbi:MAG: hypothetical protein WBK67_00425 [Minisyncoccales bacterium]|jgi:heat-inducible transcriptional repressor